MNPKIKRELEIAAAMIGTLGLISLGIAGISRFGLSTRGEKNRTEVLQDPEAIHTLGRLIIEYELPPGYKTVVGTRDPEAITVAFVSADTEMVINMGKLIGTANLPPEELNRRINTIYAQKDSNDPQDFKRVGAQEVSIDAQLVSFIIREGNSPEGKRMRQMIGYFNRGSGITYIQVYGSIANWDTEGVAAFFKSLH